CCIQACRGSCLETGTSAAAAGGLRINLFLKIFSLLAGCVNLIRVDRSRFCLIEAGLIRARLYDWIQRAFDVSDDVLLDAVVLGVITLQRVAQRCRLFCEILRLARGSAHSYAASPPPESPPESLP